jgi:cob(I)alamin adenosyltransferase
MKIYTRTGDKGTSALFSGERISKNNPRMEAYGSLDELNSQLGLVAALVREDQADMSAALEAIQHHLFLICSWVATTPGAAQREQLATIPDLAITEMEEGIDRFQERLPPLSGFIIPGGAHAACAAHVARTICRRAERRLVALQAEAEDPALERPLQFVNRLADYLFAWARAANAVYGVPEQRAPNGRKPVA